MKFNNYAYIFSGPNLDPKQHRAEIRTDAFVFITVSIGFEQKKPVIDIVREVIAAGAQMIELYGGFGPLWIAKISEAISFSVPVGSVAYGPESRQALVDLLS